jgi:hypothetical protein
MGSRKSARSWPEIPLCALVAFEAEIAGDRKNKTLVKLGNTPKQTVAAMGRLSR